MLRHEMFDQRKSFLRFKAFKLYCQDCKGYRNQQFPDIGKNQHSTRRLQAQTFYPHKKGISQKDLSKS